jgi:ABC-2 type transport system permease protein
MKAANGGTGATIAGFTYQDFVAYYLLTMVSRAFSSMPGLAGGIALQIRNGEIKKYLVQPVDLTGFLFLMRIAHKIVYYGVAIAPFALVFYLCRSYFPGWPSAEVMVAYILSLILAFMLGFFLEATIGMIGFWFLEVSSLMFVYMLFNFFFSGHMFPLDMLPAPWDTVVMVIPLQYLAYFPAAVFLQKIEGSALWNGLAIQAAWVLFFVFACRVAYWRGIQRYSGFGG